MNMLDTGLYECQGKAVTNFSRTLSAPQSDLAQAITRDPYSKELEERFTDNEWDIRTKEI